MALVRPHGLLDPDTCRIEGRSRQAAFHLHPDALSECAGDRGGAIGHYLRPQQEGLGGDIERTHHPPKLRSLHHTRCFAFHPGGQNPTSRLRSRLRCTEHRDKVTYNQIRKGQAGKAVISLLLFQLRQGIHGDDGIKHLEGRGDEVDGGDGALQLGKEVGGLEGKAMAIPGGFPHQDNPGLQMSRRRGVSVQRDRGSGSQDRLLVELERAGRSHEGPGNGHCRGTGWRRCGGAGVVTHAAPSACGQGEDCDKGESPCGPQDQATA